ncbi:neuromedin-U receptor 2-like [Asterias amurensis]|uniref:neuromedin-U receptor 2-like n=1 Tax=Asterias amurensis TaxID=7602 RepID=UPI003AB152FB
MGSDTSKAHCSVENSLNLTTHSEAREFILDPLVITLTQYLLPVILLVGLVGNAAFLFVVYRIPSMRTVTNYYLANLAVADSVFLSIVVVTRIYQLGVYGEVPTAHLGLAGCISNTIFNYSFHFAGMILITLMSLERFLAVCHPLRHRLISGRRRTIKMIVACWILAVFLTSFQIPTSMIFDRLCIQWPASEEYANLPDVIGKCSALDKPWVIPMFHLAQTLPFFVAFFGSFYFYVSIVIRLNKRNSSSDRQQVIRTRNHVAFMLIVNGTVFFLTLSPFEVTSMILFVEGFMDDVILIPHDIRGLLFEINRILLFINSAINPIVYTVTNARYRRAFKRAFTPASWSNGRPRHSTIFSTFPEYCSKYHMHMGGLSHGPPSPPPSKSPMVARPATYSNTCFDDDFSIDILNNDSQGTMETLQESKLDNSELQQVK